MSVPARTALFRQPTFEPSKLEWFEMGEVGIVDGTSNPVNIGAPVLFHACVVQGAPVQRRALPSFINRTREALRVRCSCRHDHDPFSHVYAPRALP